MSVFRIRYARKARLELLELRGWYNTEPPGRGAEFVAEVVRVTDSLVFFPRMHPANASGLHCLVVPKFTAIVYYRVAEDVVTVVAVLHTSRDRDSAVEGR